MQAWLLRKIVTIGTNAEVYNMSFFCPIEAKLGRFYLHCEKNFYKFGCYGGLPWKHGYYGNGKW